MSQTGMICTSCHEDTGVDPDLTDLPLSSVMDLCSNWLCDDCLDREEARSTTNEESQ